MAQTTKPVIMRNGVPYGGGGGSDDDGIVKMTYSEYTDQEAAGTLPANAVIGITDVDPAPMPAVMLIAPEMHRMIFRGKNLGTAVTEAQLNAIDDGSFADLFVGDYWTINGVNWRIADMDYWYNCGDTAFRKHHILIVPDTVLYHAKMNDTNTTEGGYVGSAMYTTNIEQAKTVINAVFPDMVLSHREYLVNAVSNGKASGGAWLDSTVELMNESMVYGHKEFTPGCDGTTVPANYTIDKTQLALFALAPKFITNRASQWLRDVVSAASFVLVAGHGYANYDAASTSRGVRPVFAIGKEA